MSGSLKVSKTMTKTLTEAPLLITELTDSSSLVTGTTHTSLPSSTLGYPPGSSQIITPFTSTSLPLNTYKPMYHLARPSRKLQDWYFRGRRPVLILGDSNINRIPPHHHGNIQLDSYPGANIYHFHKIMEKSPINTSTKILILAVGLNNREQDPQQTSSKQMGSLYKQAKLTFPNADIYFPKINFSPNLPQHQKDNLIQLNKYIVNHFPSLVEIPQDTFITVADNIHWTPTTASVIFSNWLRQLNLI